MKRALRAIIAVVGLVAVTGMSTAGIDGCPEKAQPATANGPCCKVCKGKVCGNSCIAKDKDCHQPPGCACDG